MKKATRTILKRIFATALCVSLCMSLLTAVAMASEGDEENPPANINLILSSDSGQEDELQQEDQKPSDQNQKQISDDQSGEQNPAGQQPDAEQNIKNSEKSTGVEQPSNEQASSERIPGEEEPGEEPGKQNENSEPTVEPPEDDTDATIVQQDNESEPAEEDSDKEETAEPEAVYSDKGQTADGHDWEMTKDATTGKYTLTITFPHSEDEALNITEDDLKNIEQYAAEVSAALAAKYGSTWEWDSTAAPSGSENVNMFQVLLSGDGNTDHTYRYDADKLEQMDGEFTLEKVDENGNLITDSEATFQLWHINEITDPDTSETVEVKMFCSYDPETNTYTFIPTESTIQTINGRIEILYAMMKDVVYYLQEVSAPVGYEVDPDIHIIMEKEVWEQEDESFRDQFSYLGEFTEDEDGRIGLDVKFVDVKNGAGDYTSDAQPTPVDTPDETPMQAPIIVPDTKEDPEPDPEPVEDPIPVPEETPEFPENPPVVEETPQNNEPAPEPVNVNMNDIPKTGDILDMFLIIAAVSAMGLITVSFLNRKKAMR